jgi:pimeloyl-ACP methyl ester carboxylesterase
VIPVANAELLAGAIPEAELHLLDESGHVYMTEEPSADEAIASFLEAHT